MKPTDKYKLSCVWIRMKKPVHSQCTDTVRCLLKIAYVFLHSYPNRQYKRCLSVGPRPVMLSDCSVCSCFVYYILLSSHFFVELNSTFDKHVNIYIPIYSFELFYVIIYSVFISFLSLHGT